MKETAHYLPQDMEEFIGNPLVEALPMLEEPTLYPKLLLVCPPYSEEDRRRPAALRLIRLQRLAELHIPTKEDTLLLLGINRCLRWGYANRNPMEDDIIAKAYKERNIGRTSEIKKYMRSINAPIYGFPVLGISGVGKTTSVHNVLSLFPQVIEHVSYQGKEFKKKQLVWLKVDCPADGTQKGLCSAILRGIDEALGSQYTEEILRNRMSKDVLLGKVSELVRALYLGIIVIDDIQNLCGTKGSVSRELLNFMVSLANSLKIPVIMVGTPRILELLQKEFQQAKRASGEGEIRMELMEKESQEWQRFIKILWKYQYTGNRVNLTDRMENAFYEESVGNPFIASTLYKVVQDDAIISRKETFTVRDIHRVANDKMGITSKMRHDMLKGIDVELNRYRHLWSAERINDPDLDKKQQNASRSTIDSYAELMTELAAKLEGTGINMASSRSFARQAMAAYPTEKNIGILLGYAMELYKASGTE